MYFRLWSTLSCWTDCILNYTYIYIYKILSLHWVWICLVKCKLWIEFLRMFLRFLVRGNIKCVGCSLKWDSNIRENSMSANCIRSIQIDNFGRSSREMLLSHFNDIFDTFARNDIPCATVEVTRIFGSSKIS